MDETWRDIPGYENLYQVSDQGRIKGVSVRCNNKYKPGRILKSANDGRGYIHIVLCRDGKKFDWHVHRLVLIAFRGSPPDGKNEVNHMNNISNDNRLENLEWVSRTENERHKYNTTIANRGTRNGSCKLSELDVKIIRNRLASGDYQHVIAQDYGVSRSLIGQIAGGRIWAWLL